MNTASTSNIEDDSEDSECEWQTINNSNKRRQRNSPGTYRNKRQAKTIETPTCSTNRFADLDDENARTNKGESSTEPRPPPLYIPNVTNVKDMNRTFSSVIPSTQYTYKALGDSQIRVMVKTITSYRTLVSYLKIKNISFHTFQIKQDRAYRVVIKNLHYSTNTDDIKTFIEKHDHKVRNISNITSNLTKKPLSMFFVDLEPKDNNKEIYNITHINNAIVTIEPPRKIKNIPQCHRCQQYGHTKSYCHKPYKCVKCGANHITAECTKNQASPPKCANCQESHPASYRGCIVHQELKRKMQNKVSNYHHGKPIPNSQNMEFVNNVSPPMTHNISYSDAVRGNNISNNTSENSLLQKIETLLTKQMEMTNTLLNMMSLICGKLCQ